MNYLLNMFSVFLLLSLIIGLSFNPAEETIETPFQTVNSSKIETFRFSSNGEIYNGKIYLPDSYKNNKNLPAIFLIDFTEQHFKLATDEFEKVIEGVHQINDFEALVVALEEIADIDAEPEAFQKHYDIYKNMALYIDGKYTKNQSRTFIGKGSESGVVIGALFAENSENPVFENFIATDPSGLYGTHVINLIENGNFPQNKHKMKLHFSFTKSNDRQKCNKIIQLFNEANYPWLQFESVEYTDSDYENTYPVSYAAGLKYVFDDE